MTDQSQQQPKADESLARPLGSARIPHKCPVCDGSGLVSRPPGVAADQPVFSGTSCGPWPCNACGGSGVLWS